MRIKPPSKMVAHPLFERIFSMSSSDTGTNILPSNLVTLSKPLVTVNLTFKFVDAFKADGTSLKI